jgi:ABC-type sugar transport system ATPase subunit
MKKTARLPKDEVVLSAQGIIKDFPCVHAIDRIGFKLRKGEIHVFLGEKGAGKSTLMKIIAGILTPTAWKTQGYDAIQ